MSTTMNINFEVLLLSGCDDDDDVDSIFFVSEKKTGESLAAEFLAAISIDDVCTGAVISGAIRRLEMKIE